MSDFRGRWEGDTLVVNMTLFTGETSFDRAGNFHSPDLHVVERYTRTGPDHLLYEVTIDDPKVFTRPWKMRIPVYRRQNPIVSFSIRVLRLCARRNRSEPQLRGSPLRSFWHRRSVRSRWFRHKRISGRVSALSSVRAGQGHDLPSNLELSMASLTCRDSGAARPRAPRTSKNIR